MSKNVARYGLLASLALLMGYVESLVAVPLPVPGIKLGLANVIVLLAFYSMGTKSAFVISILRILMSALLFSGFASFLYSAAGASLSFIIMYGARHIKPLGIVGVSVLGAIGHNIGQILVAIAVLKIADIVYFAPVLIVAAVISGVATGSAARIALRHISFLN